MSVSSSNSVESSTGPLVTVMIPTYNQERFIVRAIESALKQEYRPIEIVVADDCSGDETEAIVARFIAAHGNSPVRYVRNPTNLGILRNYHNILFEHAAGEWVVNLDGDDFFVDPGFIRQAVSAAMNDPETVLVFGDYCEYMTATESRVDIRNHGLPQHMDGNDFISRFAHGDVEWNHNSIIYRRADAVSIGFYWDADGARNDWESFLRLVVNRKVAYVKCVAAAWVQHGGNETRRLDPSKYLRNYALIEGVGEYAKSQGVNATLVRGWVDAMNSKKTRSSVFAYLMQGDLPGAFSFLRQVGEIDSSQAHRVLMSPEFWLRALLGLNPGWHARAKALRRSLSGRTGGTKHSN